MTFLTRKSCRYGLAFLVASFIAGSAGAERYDSDVLLRHKSWSVELTYDNDDSDFWCEASTKNKSAQTFSIVAYQSGELAVIVFDHDWALTPRDLEFILDVDYSRWVINGTGDGIAVSVLMQPGPKLGEFITDIAEGSAVALYNRDERRLATFSLAGSKAALLKLNECWRAILKDNADPFKSSSDPF
ncbi:hypothetical protein N6L24_09550 [Cognatishimia sp. SS12]|uniref:hypothetical protein n=1 Tax=Cognatishimia sp. SS12 TaxID=2979465 RepID=UPI00232C49CA|nr:hypothetical protein [Cognatishimia sp. SS12]MDC0738524.1 hypothetical protein [Cognatishimia sp. SS12]